jgi:hypothetical protein
MTQNPSLVCAKPPHHVRVEIHRVWRRAESILCVQRGPNPLWPLHVRLDLRALLSAVAMEAAIDGRNPNMLPDTSILAVPGMARRQDRGRLYDRYCTRGWSCVATSRCFPCDRLHAADSLGRIAWNEGFQAPEESLGLGLGEISAWPCAVVVCSPCSLSLSGAVRASFGSVLGFAEDAVGRPTDELRYWDPQTLTSGQQRVKINTRYHLKFPSVS